MAATRWRLRRNCSLTPQQALLAWALPNAVLLGVTLFAAFQGWWWVVAFALLNIAGLATALWLYSRHALDGETLFLADDGMLHIEQQCGTRLQHLAWRASLVSLEVAEDGPITLRAGRERLEIGSQAAPATRDMTARELRRALRLDAGM